MVKQHPRQPPGTPPTATKKHGKGPTGAELGEQIGETLRAMFDDVVTEPVPERFRSLLEKLERKSRKS